MPGAPDGASGVCPPFKLRDEQGQIIDPVRNVNAAAPYSPKQTCGACHDYAKITEGFHFTQGKGEAMPTAFARRYAWTSSPGNYGGNWCSPAPLYRQLAPKSNASARTIDLTSFDFVTATCGNCHPGGGPLEYDRDGHRYDERMLATGLTPGGDNGFDGDYYKARWSETGVIEADCLLCHQPEYDYKSRNAQLADLNFRWAATEGAGFGTVSGKVTAGEKPRVAYDLKRFDADGSAILHIAPAPRNETCLNCHAKPDWKKRGASFSHRTDVHMAAGLRCVDCHAAGSRAHDPRIRGKEAHQFGKGDDPSGHVRNDLDNTVRSCESCHVDEGGNAPKSSHAWLPPLHLEKLSCQACHIPSRSVKSALIQASDVYNPAPRITPPGKHIWTFYDQEVRFWNHYGELELFTNKDQPTNVTRPTLARYKGKIYPVNRVHSAWVGFEEQGKEGLNQLFMKDFFTIWKEHLGSSQERYPQLSRITDDNGDGHLEINRPDEIDAILAAVREHLTRTNFPLENRRLVWVSDGGLWYSSAEYRPLEKESHEATPYASVYKFSHDIAPARAALGAGGCIDCHSRGLDVAFAPGDAEPRWVANHTLMGISPLAVSIGAAREQWIKPAWYASLAVAMAMLVLLGLRNAAIQKRVLRPRITAIASITVLMIGLVFASTVARTPELLEYLTVRRFTLDANHFWLALLSVGLATSIAAGRADGGRVTRTLGRVLWLLVGASAVCGLLMLMPLKGTSPLVRFAYTGLDANLLLMSVITAALLLHQLARIPESERVER